MNPRSSFCSNWKVLECIFHESGSDSNGKANEGNCSYYKIKAESVASRAMTKSQENGTPSDACPWTPPTTTHFRSRSAAHLARRTDSHFPSPLFQLSVNGRFEKMSTALWAWLSVGPFLHFHYVEMRFVELETFHSAATSYFFSPCEFSFSRHTFPFSKAFREGVGNVLCLNSFSLDGRLSFPFLSPSTLHPTQKKQKKKKTQKPGSNMSLAFGLMG